MQQPVSKVDVVIPVFNGQETIIESLASIQSQTERSLRIIVVNDGSTDNTKSLVEEAARSDNRIVLIDQPNGGIVSALNAGLDACEAAFVARHDADDLAAPDRFERQLTYLHDHPDCVAVSGAVVHIDAAGRVLSGIQQTPSPDLADLDSYPQREPYLPHPFLMMRLSAARQAGGYRYAFHAEDTDLYWRLQEAGGLVNMPELMGSYRIHPQSITGASLLNGRISALNSQLAGISARRRRTGRQDLAFRPEALAEYKAAETLSGMLLASSRQLDAEEGRRLAACVCAKMLELVNYRPYELDDEDCRFIYSTLTAALAEMPDASRQNCLRMLSGTAARMASSGRLAAAVRLAPVRTYPMLAARLAARVFLARPVRRALLRAIGRTGFEK